MIGCGITSVAEKILGAYKVTIFAIPQFYVVIVDLENVVQALIL